MPKAGTPRRDTRSKCSGNSPSVEAAKGISAQSIVQPLRAPKPEITTIAAMSDPPTTCR